MLNCFPQTNQNYEVLLLTLDKLCAGLSDRAIIEAAERFASGDVKDQSKKFAPAAPELVEEARRRQDYIDLLSKPRIAPPELYRRGPLSPSEMTRQKALSDNAHLPVLLEDISFETWKRLSKDRQIPTGAKWVACLGIVYGPKPKITIDAEAA